MRSPQSLSRWTGQKPDPQTGRRPARSRLYCKSPDPALYNFCFHPRQKDFPASCNLKKQPFQSKSQRPEYSCSLSYHSNGRHSPQFSSQYPAASLPKISYHRTPASQFPSPSFRQWPPAPPTRPCHRTRRTDRWKARRNRCNS